MGKNRRMSHQTHLFSGGIIRCAHCGFAMTGERIRRRIRGGIREHVYYRCASNVTGNKHPPIRWREDEIERRIIEELESFKMPTQIAEWFRAGIKAAYSDVEAIQKRCRQTLTKRRTELVVMQERLLNAFLSSAIEEKTFHQKTAEMKHELTEVEASLAQAVNFDPDAPARAMAIFDFSQNVGDMWRRSNSEEKREILDAISLNRTLSDTSLDVAKRCPFGHLQKHADFQNGRGDWHSFEPSLIFIDQITRTYGDRSEFPFSAVARLARSA